MSAYSKVCKTAAGVSPVFQNWAHSHSVISLYSASKGTCHEAKSCVRRCPRSLPNPEASFLTRKFGRSTSGASHLRPATRGKRTGRSRRTLYASRASPSPPSSHVEPEHITRKSPEASYPHEADRPIPEDLECFMCVPGPA